MDIDPTCFELHVSYEWPGTGFIFEKVLFSYNSNNQQSNENKTYSKISRVIERIDQVTSLTFTC